MYDKVPEVSENVTDTFETFVLTRSVALQRFANLLCGNAEDARDIVQDAFTSLVPKWEVVSKRGNPEAYIRRSIMNISVSRWRKYRREYSWDPDWLESAMADPAAEIANTTVVRQWCSQLPPKQRAAIVMRFFEDCSYEQIAVWSGTTPGAARKLVHRAVTTLRARLKEDSDA